MWDARYSEEGWAYGTDPNDLLREAAAHLPPGPVLCLAEGEGRNAVWLACQGFEVTAVDQSAVGLQKAAALAAQHGVELETQVCDLADYDLGSAQWAGVVSIWCHLPQPLRAQVHAAIVRALRPGGVLILEAYTPEQLAYRTGGPQTPALLFAPEEVMAELAGLEWIHATRVVREVREGKYHNGPSAVLQLVGRKIS